MKIAAAVRLEVISCSTDHDFMLEARVAEVAAARAHEHHHRNGSLCRCSHADHGFLKA